MIDAARQITGQPIKAEIGPRRPGDPATLIAGSETIKRELGWAPEFASLEAIIGTAWDWHRTIRKGYGA